jgi:hypothetical protein
MKVHKLGWLLVAQSALVIAFFFFFFYLKFLWIYVQQANYVVTAFIGGNGVPPLALSLQVTHSIT